jgi:hypothetical protein
MFAMQGEMSATVVRYPRSWTSLVSRIKNDIVTLRDDADLLMPNLKVGGEWWAARRAVTAAQELVTSQLRQLCCVSTMPFKSLFSCCNL